MNTYDAKHLQLLNLIEAGQVEQLSENDLHELRVLVVCKYVSLGESKEGKPLIALTQEGRHYRRQLAQLTALKGAGQAQPMAATA